MAVLYSERPSICGRLALLFTFLWFAGILLALVSINALSIHSVFIAIVTSIIFLLSANALVRGTIDRCR